MSAFALARFGIKPDEFGKMTPGYFALLCREADTQDFRHYLPAASIQALLANIHRDSEKCSQTFEPIDFMPGWERTPDPEAEKLKAQAFLFALDGVVADAEARKQSNGG